MTTSFYNGVSGLKSFQYGIDTWAYNIANVNTKDFQSVDAKIVDKLEISTNTSNKGTNLTKELTDQIIIEKGYKAQAPAIKTQDEMTKTLLDIMA